MTLETRDEENVRKGSAIGEKLGIEMCIRAITEIYQEDVALIHLPPSLNINTIGNKHEV